MYFPWVGFMEMMKLADVFVWLDDVQFSRGSFTNRVQVKLQSGTKWMTIPLLGKGVKTAICDLSSADDTWRKSHRSILLDAFTSAPYRESALEIFDNAIAREPLSEVLISSCEAQAIAMDALPKRIERVGNIDAKDTSWRRVIQIVKAVGGSRYVSGAGGANYLDHEAFDREGLSIEYMDYNPIPWPQSGLEFTPYVTGLDLIAACGIGCAAHLRPRTISWRERIRARSESSKD